MQDEERGEICKGCGKDVSRRYLTCDEQIADDAVYCDDCFEAQTHCAEKHGEGCATLVLSD